MFSYLHDGTIYEPMWDFMDKEIKKRKNPSQQHYLWDDNKAAGFIMSELLRDGANYADLNRSLWISKKLKFVSKEYVPFVQNYIQTQERDYTYVINGLTVFQRMQRYRKTYPEAILYGCPMDVKIDKWKDKNANGEIVDYVWDYPLDDWKQEDNKCWYIILDDDKNGYHEMTPLQKDAYSLWIDIGWDQVEELLKISDETELKQNLDRYHKTIETNKTESFIRTDEAFGAWLKEQGWFKEGTV